MLAAPCGASAAPADEPAPAGGSCALEEAAARASSELAMVVAVVECRAGGARIRLFPPGGAPLDVDVAEPPGPAFARAGRLRVSPIVESLDWAAGPAAGRDAFAALRGWLERHEPEIRFVPAPAMSPPPLSSPPRAAWLLLVAIALAVGGLGIGRGPRSIHRRDFGVFFALLIVSALARAVFGLWGPLHVNGQGGLWIRAALFDPAQVADYGPGYAELASPIARLVAAVPELGREIDRAVFGANLLASALVPPLAFAIGRVFGLSRPRALLAGALLAVDPIAVRCAASESYFPSILALATGARLLLALAARAATERSRGWIATGLLIVSAGLLAAQAARIHPVAWLPVALCPLAALAVAPPAHGGAGRRIVFTVAAGVALGGLCLALDGAILLARLRGAADHLPPPSGAALGGLALIAVAALLLRRARTGLTDGVWLGIPAAIELIALLATWHAYGQSELWRDAYARLFLVGPALAIAALIPPFIPALRGGPRARAWLPAIGLIALLVDGARVAGTLTTEQREYGFLRDRLARLPAGARVAFLARAGARVSSVPSFRIARTGAAAVEIPIADRPGAASGAIGAALVSPGRVVWARTSICASVEGRPLCDQAERGVALAPFERAVLPAVPSSDALPYEGPSVEVTLSEALRR